MKIAHIEIRNFRKLKFCRVEFSGKETIFVGANNSGKTSAMDALMLFLKKDRRGLISTTDFTLSNWHCINLIGKAWVENKDDNSLNLNIQSWEPFLPSVDIWLDVSEDEIHYVKHIIPTLSWEGGLLGVRLRFEPKSVEDLYKEFNTSYNAAQQTITGAAKRKSKQKLSLWPQTMRDFLDRKLHPLFVVKAYILNPSKLEKISPECAHESVSLDGEPFDGLFKIDIINAQRGFSDPKTPNAGNSTGGLSAQLRHYYSKHLNPSELPAIDDIEALEAIETARTAFDNKLRDSFKPAIGELEGLGYPGFSDPEIVLTSKINPIDGLDHDAAVQFNVLKNHDSSESTSLCLPEKYNGLGYQNLVSMVFNLIRFRDEWMRRGKAGKKQEAEDSIIEPLHLVLIEEPEAHLHAQVQQVFIKKAYSVLRNHENLKDSIKFTTQLIVSTHSSHIAHEVDFSCLRYFKRKPPEKADEVPCATVVNLSTTFGCNDDTSKFASRYLKTTHCDLFFADAAILVEGPAERMLVPHFVKNEYPFLDSRYITLLEIGGSHAHRLKPLIETLGLLTLIITDIDSIGKTDNGKVLPKQGQDYRSGNATLKTWLPRKDKLDELLDSKEKLSQDSLVRVAYQCPFKVHFNGVEQEALPYTFEDSLVLSNIDNFKAIADATGLTKKMVDAIANVDFIDVCQTMFDALANGKKAEMALDLLYAQDLKKLMPPPYIKEGLEWLQKELERKDLDLAATELNKNGGAK
jgi:predicted ATP-dependent endonuclease of OLD family